MPFVFFFTPVLITFLAGQAYWILRVRALLRRHIESDSKRILLGIGGIAVYVLWFAYNFGWLGTRREDTRMTVAQAVLVSPFLWWIFSSTVAFAVAAIIWILASIAKLGAWGVRRLAPRPAPVSVSRRRLLAHTANAVVGAPFVLGAYGLLYGRLNLETTNRRIRLARLPRAFEGFRIAQLSDIHIGPYMDEEQIRKYVRIANELKPDLVVLTGDFITWDRNTEEAVVGALSGLKAPFGVFGCLGNHDRWAGAEDSLTALFRQIGVHILRQENVAIATHGEQFNLMGVDFPRRGGFRSGILDGVEGLIVPGAANLLLSHSPATFDRAAALGIDLSLAGHTHGGQVALEFVDPEIAPSRIVTPYVSGWFEKPGGQLYVNRGIGTIAAPMRIGAPPEITVFELARPL